MAEPKRLRGYLQEAVRRILEDQPSPLSGLELAAMLRSEGYLVSPSLVFRAIRRLVDQGSIRKVLVAGGYALVREDRAITLFCGQCGGLYDIPCVEAFDALDHAAAANGLAASRYIVEIEGRCSRCAEGITPG